MAGLGYHENREVFIVSEGDRAIFERPEAGLHIDVFFEKLDFCHVIHWKERLEVDQSEHSAGRDAARKNADRADQ